MASNLLRVTRARLAFHPYVTRSLGLVLLLSPVHGLGTMSIYLWTEHLLGTVQSSMLEARRSVKTGHGMQTCKPEMHTPCSQQPSGSRTFSSPVVMPELGIPLQHTPCHPRASSPSNSWGSHCLVCGPNSFYTGHSGFFFSGNCGENTFLMKVPNINKRRKEGDKKGNKKAGLRLLSQDDGVVV